MKNSRLLTLSVFGPKNDVSEMASVLAANCTNITSGFELAYKIAQVPFAFQRHV
jgi:hypothetical protein